MLRGTSKKVERKRRVRFAGIVTAAQELGVSRFHLYRVLKGERQSRRLLRAYAAFAAKEARAR